MISSRHQIQVCTVLAFLLTAVTFGATKISSEENGVNRLVIHTDQGRNTIAPEIYGHFAEHLGRCIYEGFWVGEDSSIPNVRGIRKDVVEALKKLNIGVLRWPGGCFADEYSLHYYVRGTGNWTRKGSATNFDETEWFALMKNTHGVYDLLRRNIEIMDKYDPRKRVGLFVDEWGTWWDAEPGTNPGFLYQQNTLRDAVSAGIFLNAFNENCQRVRMANIAQTNNVLQAMILTRGKDMILTPTYHVFEMFKVHQGGTYLPNDLTCNPYKHNSETIPAISVSASKDKNGAIHITLCNLDPQMPAELVCELPGTKPKKVSGRVLTADKMNTHNTFDHPDAIKPTVLKGLEIKGANILATLPAKSVVVLTVK